MSHWAEIDDQNIVVRVLVGDNNAPDEGEEFVKSLGGTWVKTSYNGTIRKNFAGIGFTFDEANDWFHAPQPFASWTLNANAQWVAPVEKPTDDKLYAWDEEEGQWNELS
jgi:hypothetical protein